MIPVHKMSIVTQTYLILSAKVKVDLQYVLVQPVTERTAAAVLGIVSSNQGSTVFESSEY